MGLDTYQHLVNIVTIMITKNEEQLPLNKYYPVQTLTLQVTTKSVDLLQHEVNILLGLSLVGIVVGDEDDEDGGNELFFQSL